MTDNKNNYSITILYCNNDVTLPEENDPDTDYKEHDKHSTAIVPAPDKALQKVSKHTDNYSTSIQKLLVAGIIHYRTRLHCQRTANFNYQWKARLR